MKAKLTKITGIYTLLDDNDRMVASDDVDMQKDYEIGKLSTKNCDDIFGVVDVWSAGLEIELDKLPYTKHLDDGQYNDGQVAGFELGAEWGFNKAMELNKDKVFTLEDMKKCWEYASIDKHQIFGDQIGDSYMSFIQSLQQPTEIEVEIEMFKSDDIKSVEKDWYKIGEPKLDSEGCLILKKI